MALKISTGLRNKLLDTGSFATVMAGGLVKIYSGTAPLTADDAIGSAGTNVLLCTISIDGLGTGINMEAAAVGGTIEKKTTEAWKGTNAASGVATFYRHVAVGDNGSLSTTQARLQGAIGTAGAEMNFTSTSLTAGADQNVDYYRVTLPTA